MVSIKSYPAKARVGLYVLCDVEDPIFSIQSADMAVKLSALYAGRTLPLRKIPGTHFCYRLSKLRGHSAVGRTGLTKKELMGNQSR
jgi:hypothetical protein